MDNRIELEFFTSEMESEAIGKLLKYRDPMGGPKSIKGKLAISFEDGESVEVNIIFSSVASWRLH